MKKKLLYAILGVAVVTSIAFGCKTTAPANVDRISEGVVAEISSDDVKEVTKKETASEVEKKEVKTEKASETKKEDVKQESKESSSEKKSEKVSEKVVADSGKTVAADTKKTTTTTGAVKQTGTTAGQTTQTTNKVNTTNTTTNTTKGTQTTQGTQVTGSTTQKTTTTTSGGTVTNNTPTQQTTTQQTTTQTTTQQTTTQAQNTTQTTTGSTNNTVPAPGTPEFDAMTKAWEDQIAAENNQQQQISSSDNQKLLDEINAYREENGLNPLTWSDELGQQANTRAQEQTDNTVNNGGDIDHNYGTAHDDNARENLSSRQGDDVLEGWQNSPGHNNTLLDPNATTAGVATGNAGDGEGNGVTVLIIE